MGLKRVIVETGARLHLGFYKLSSRVYGGFGVMLDKPMTRVVATPGEGCEGYACMRIPRELHHIMKKERVRLEIKSSVKPHVGLGSTTQLLLASCYAIGKVLGWRVKAIDELYEGLRGFNISAVGYYGFKKGGFIADLWVKDKRSKPIIRLRTPLSWRFIVVNPLVEKVFPEERELEFLRNPPSLPGDLEQSLTDLFFSYIIPSILWDDIVSFGKALTKIQRLVGMYFSKAQHGIFCCRETERAVNALLEAGVFGAGQSSWGPTAYGVVLRENVERVFKHLVKGLKKKGVKAEVFVARPLNRSAYIRVEKT